MVAPVRETLDLEVLPTASLASGVVDHGLSAVRVVGEAPLFDRLGLDLDFDRLWLRLGEDHDVPECAVVDHSMMSLSLVSDSPDFTAYGLDQCAVLIGPDAFDLGNGDISIDVAAAFLRKRRNGRHNIADSGEINVSAHDTAPPQRSRTDLDNRAISGGISASFDGACGYFCVS